MSIHEGDAAAFADMTSFFAARADQINAAIDDYRSAWSHFVQLAAALREARVAAANINSELHALETAADILNSASSKLAALVGNLKP